MADLAVGISKTVLEALVNKVRSAIAEDAVQWQALERDIVFIKDEFEVMQSFLHTANGEYMKNQLVRRTWARQIRDLSYDTEDCIEFVLHLDPKQSFWWRRLVPSCMVPPSLPLDQAVAEVKLLKARAEDVDQRNRRYSLIGDSGQQMLQTSAVSQRTLETFIKPRDASGNENGSSDLTRLITTEDDGLQVISVCGTGGDLGTLSIIKQTYDEPKICETFEYRAWVKLMHPSNIHEFIRSLLTEFYALSDEGQGADKAVHVRAKMGATTEDHIVEDFFARLIEKRYLIVLEDLSSLVQWDAITKLMPDKNNRSRIVVSTKHLEIASLCTGQPYQVSLLRKFSTDHSVCAFFKEGSLRDGLSTTRHSVASWCPTSEGTASHSQDNSLLGRGSEVNKLKEQINLALSGETHHVVSVCGVAGVGKSFLVKTVYNDPSSPVKKFYRRAGASALHPFDIVDLCKSLLLCPEFNLKEPTKCEDIVKQCWEHLKQKRCLVVIDDLRSKEDWDLIKTNLISRASKSCIIVITREQSVAGHCATSNDAVCRLQGLEADIALRLFEKVTKKEAAGPSSSDPHMSKEARVIINKCGRLPKLIVALGEYFAKEQNAIREMQRLINANFMYELKTSKGLDSFWDVFTWMYSTFQACPLVLKKCIFYLSLFTQSSIIRRSRLVRRWIAEGYSQGTDSNGLVEYAEKLLGRLATLGIIEQPPQTPTMDGEMRMTSCQVNTLFLNYIISRETEENIFLPPLEVSVLQGESSLSTQPAGQHLAIGSSWRRDKFVFQSLDLLRLRSLTVSREWKSFFISDKTRVLRVLDLEDTNVKDDDVEKIVEQVPRLKFLSLRKCTKVTHLPYSLGGLRQLQTLDIRHTSVSMLPQTVIKLSRLQYIRAGISASLMDEELSTHRGRTYGHDDPCDGVKVPLKIGDLMNLQTLGVINCGSSLLDVITCGGTSGIAILKELKNLTQLRKLGVSGINRTTVKVLFSAIVGHGHLESLSLQLHMDKDLDWLGKITPPQNLQRLKMYVRIEKFQHWSCLQVLGQIRRLHTLCLHFKTGQNVDLRFPDGQVGSSNFGPFYELKVLEIACSSNLHVKFAKFYMSKLELLKVRCFNGSSLMLSGLEHPRSLKRVWVKGSFDETVKEELEQKLAQHKNKPVLKMDVA